MCTRNEANIIGSTKRGHQYFILRKGDHEVVEVAQCRPDYVSGEHGQSRQDQEVRPVPEKNKKQDVAQNPQR